MGGPGVGQRGGRTRVRSARLLEVVLGVSQLGVIACFTFASIKPIHFEPSAA